MRIRSGSEILMSPNAFPGGRLSRDQSAPKYSSRNAELLNDCGDFVGTGHRCVHEMLHKFRATVDLLGAGGVALLRFFALPDRNRQELVGAAIEEQVAGNEAFALECANVLRPFGDGRLRRARLR